MSLYSRTANILQVLLAFYPIYSDAANFTQCFIGVTNCASDPGSQECLSSFNLSNVSALSLLRTSKGSQVISSVDATALVYTGCVEYCGGGQEPFSWSTFSQEYSAWLLPYLALISQLPFGAPRRMDNLMSAFLTLGSPTLAGYSLYLTLLNARWLNDKLFAGIDYPSAEVRRCVVRALSSLQHVPLRIHPGKSALFESLVVHPDNDEWWATLASELNYSHTWSIASATSITWVVIAYLLSVADALSNVAENINSSGEGTGSVWLWLLPIVVGWLILSPKCDYDRVHDAYNKANRRVFVADSHGPRTTSTRVTSKLNDFGLTISPSPDWELQDEHITSPDELRIPPVFNYARTLSWSRSVYLVSLFYRTAWRKSNHRVGVDGEHIPGNDIPRVSRLGTRDQVICYCHPDDYERLGTNVLWPRGVFFNMIVASLMSLLLQWGTTISAIVRAWFTPTIGLGCRSLAYLIYGMVSTIVWVLLVSSSALGYYVDHLTDDQSLPDLECYRKRTKHPKPTLIVSAKCNSTSELSDVAIPLVEFPPAMIHPGREDTTDADEPASVAPTGRSHSGPTHVRMMAWLADLLRWTGKLLAIVNTIGLVTNSVFQYAGVYDRCFCNSSVFTWGPSAFSVITPIQSDITLATNGWIGGLAIALTCCSIFVGTIFLVGDSLPS